MSCNFPNEIITDIVLLKLPVKSLLRFKSVCKSWRSLIKDGQFFNQHCESCKSDVNYHKTLFACFKNRSPLNFYSIGAPQQHGCVVSIPGPPVTELNHGICDGYFVNSCNGLILLHCLLSKIVLWNPAINESRTIKIEEGGIRSDYSLTLGYVSSLDDYKIVSIRRKVDPVGYNFQVFSTKSNTWKSINHLLHPNYNLFYGDKIVADGIIYTMISSPSEKFILCLCLESEKFEQTKYPGDQGIGESEPILFAQGECLFLAELFTPKGLTNLQVWCMKKNGMSSSWSKIILKITFPRSNWSYRSHMQPLGFTSDGDMLFLERGELIVVIYDRRRQNLKKVQMTGLGPPCHFLNRAVTYLETMISPNAL